MFPPLARPACSRSWEDGAQNVSRRQVEDALRSPHRSEHVIRPHNGTNPQCTPRWGAHLPQEAHRTCCSDRRPRSGALLCGCLENHINRPLLLCRSREHGSERPSCAESTARILHSLTKRAELPHTARVSRHSGLREASNRSCKPKFERTDRAKARGTASG